MFLYPYKIFALANKGKRLFNISNPRRFLGIYDVELMNYKTAKRASEKFKDSYISVLLGEIKKGVYLNALDLDGCKNEDGSLTEPAKELLKYFNENEYEDSISGSGGHIYILTTKKYETFKIKQYFGDGEHKDLEFYADKRYILSTTVDFDKLDIKVDKYNDLLDELYNKSAQAKQEKLQDKLCRMFEGKVIKDTTQFQMSRVTGRQPVTDMHTLRGCGYKDTKLIELIDAEPSSVNQSDHDAALLRKLMYYTLSFDSAYEMAKKTNYYKHKDKKHQDKFNNPSYIQRTRNLIERGYV